MAMMAAAMFASCSNEETIVVAQPDEIGFGAPFIENSTRASVDYYTTVDAFKVWGDVKGNVGVKIMLYNGAEVELEDGVYTCNQKEYWLPLSIYNFLAIAGATNVTPETGFPTTVSYTADGTTDLLISEKVTVETDQSSTPSGAISNSKVAFTFQHLLSKVVFSAVGAEGDGYTYEVTDIQIMNAKAEGSVDVQTKSWNAPTGTKTIGDFGGIAGAFDGNYTECQYPMLLIPHDYVVGSEIEISMVVTTYFNNELVQITEYTGEQGKEPRLKAAVNLQPGCSYNFKFEVNVGMPIDFSVGEQQGWNDNTINIS